VEWRQTLMRETGSALTATFAERSGCRLRGASQPSI
jgi:hypothetical protein